MLGLRMGCGVWCVVYGVGIQGDWGARGWWPVLGRGFSIAYKGGRE